MFIRYIIKNIKKYNVVQIIRIKYWKNMEKNIRWLYIIIFQSLTLKYWFYIIYDFLSVFSYSNFIYTNYRNKNKYKKYSTLEHELNIIKRHCDDMTYVNNKSKYYMLIADKGYISSELTKINNKNVIRILPKKSNSKIKNTIKNKKFLKDHRYKIENVNASLKKMQDLIQEKTN